MRFLPIFTLFVAATLGLSELARWWDDLRLVPLAFDELAVAIAMVVSVLTYRRFGFATIAAAWAFFSGLSLSLLVPTLDHLIFGPPKASAGIYAVILGAMLAVGIACTLWALASGRRRGR